MSEFEELDERDRRLAIQLQERLRASEQLDFVTQAKLSAARTRALAAAPRHTGWWLATGGLTAAAVLAAMLVLRAPQPLPATADALDLLTDDVDPEFYQDLDLYQWAGGNRARQCLNCWSWLQHRPRRRRLPPSQRHRPADLIEFLGDWSDDEASLIDEARPPAKAAPPTAKTAVPAKEKRGTQK